MSYRITPVCSGCDCQMIRWPSQTGWRCLICDTAPGQLPSTAPVDLPLPAGARVEPPE